VTAPPVVAIPVAGAHELEAEARLHPGAPGVVVCHPHPAFGGRMDTPLVVALDDALAEAGLSTVRFNFRGVGASGGRGTGGRDEPGDVRAACAWLRAWADDFPSVRLDVLAGAGHFFAGPAERDVAARVARFLLASTR